MGTIWTAAEIARLEEKYKIKAGRRLHAAAEDFHFPGRSFLRAGYAPPGGYVKDFSVRWHEGRLHLFHIDGRPGEVCWVTGNEVSFGHASTADLCHWIRHPMPLAVGDRVWESEHVWAPFLHRQGDLFYLFYMGGGPDESVISYATSTDLEKWTRWPQGPIPGAKGRDPFVFVHEGRVILIYTGNGGARIAAGASEDLISWTPLPDLIDIPGGDAAESPSLHPLREGFVLWFNDCRRGLAGFRAAYAFSRDPFHFDPASIREFDFQSDAPDIVPSLELPVTKPVPLSIEWISTRAEVWLVAYFRWQGDRDRLFFGELDWTHDPAVLREITDPQRLAKWLK